MVEMMAARMVELMVEQLAVGTAELKVDSMVVM
jgi:hypothetical protein